MICFKWNGIYILSMLHLRSILSLKCLNEFRPIHINKTFCTTKECCHKNPEINPKPLQKSQPPPFWYDKQIWRRAGENTLRCLVGCSIGDFSTMFYLQAYHPHLPLWMTVVLPMGAGIITSISIETIALKFKEKMDWIKSFKMAYTMSIISMLTMELVENLVDLYFTGGMMNFYDVYFWLALIPSLLAGFLAPLPYNYWRLKKHGKSCH